MSTSIYNQTLNPRLGKFGPTQQHFERKFNDYIDDIRLTAEGFLTPVTIFTKKNSGILDGKKLKDTADAVVNTFDRFKNDSEKDFYRAFLYCALALLSLDFEYYSAEVPNTILSFPPEKNCRMDFRYLLENLELETDNDKTCLNTDSIFAMYLPPLHELLSGKSIELRSAYTEMSLSLTSGESSEMLEDVFANAPADPSDYFGPEDLADEYCSDGGLRDEEIKEGNTLMSSKLKATFPEYKEFIKNMERFAELFDDNISPAFRTNVRMMTSAFLAEGGYTIFNNEDAYVDLMVSLTGARKTCLRATAAQRKD